MPIADPVIYLKKSLRSLWNQPKLNTLISILRHYRVWREHLQPGRNSVDDRTPWMSFSAIEYINKITKPGMRVFEFGSGGSTMFWLSRVLEVISVEHDLTWFTNMKSKLSQEPGENVKYMLAEPVPDPGFPGKQFKNPGDFVSGDPAYAGKNFESYARSIDPYPNEYFDIIIVDGRARPSCIQQSLPKLKRNGWLIIDNTEREYYTAPFSFDRKSWKISTFAGPVPYMRDFSETTILKKLI